jgi:hypothetical protein
MASVCVHQWVGAPAPQLAPELLDSVITSTACGWVSKQPQTPTYWYIYLVNHDGCQHSQHFLSLAVHPVYQISMGGMLFP